MNLENTVFRIWLCCHVETVEHVSMMIQDPDVINARLPVFHRPPSAERDVTIMRPAANNISCLQVQQANEYLVPLLGPGARDLPSSPSTSSVAKLLPANSTSERETSSVLPESRSTQPLLEEALSNSSDSTGKQSDELNLVTNTFRGIFNGLNMYLCRRNLQFIQSFVWNVAIKCTLGILRKR
jgi:hypothetical protein